MNRLLIVIFLVLTSSVYAKDYDSRTKIKGELKKWHKVTLQFEGPYTSETYRFNPFFDYRLDVSFKHVSSGKEYTVPGYFAADGNAGETSATEGNQWKVHFTPDMVGQWTYTVSFRMGKYVATSALKLPGDTGGYMDGATGEFKVTNTDKTGKDFRAKGRLRYVGERYLRFEETKEYFLKQGPDSPENLLAYEDFDGTFHNDGQKDDLVKTWQAHIDDWQVGDPSWNNNKGKGLIGAINYLSNKGLNSISFITNNIAGDDRNVFPYTDYTSFGRMDVSKLDQWEVIFDHAQKKGLFLHFKMSEMENQGLLDNGGVGANTKLYYRELIARFGHHLALNWNIGEENGEWRRNQPTPAMTTMDRKSAIKYFEEYDPYRHHIVIHNGVYFDDLLGAETKLSGLSVQTHHVDFGTIHKTVLHWLDTSKHEGRQWAVAVDEPGDAQHALTPDIDDKEHNTARKNGLWGTLMAGGWGNEWYFGYKHDHSDLSCQDFRSRDLFWDQAVSALKLFEVNKVPFWEMTNRNDLVGNSSDLNTVYCLAIENEIYLIYINQSTEVKLDLSNASEAFKVSWFDPKTATKISALGPGEVKGGQVVGLNSEPLSPNKDFVLIVKKN